MSLSNNAMTPGREIFRVFYWDNEEKKIKVNEYDTEEEATKIATHLVASGDANYAHLYKSEYINSFDSEVIIEVNKRF